ncbi:transglycosylase SLT domain-containing protein [Arenibaculum sp.]|uniref:transglycosylase SLT domain-containing protein n=1 Tax=Arenibaculum sp. TaxID=2865862 RepID=UPI002E1237CD|nr:transglycosylase SLT domain-containing protein [Arenibaculum sp.]
MEQLSESGSVRASFELGRHYEMGIGVPADHERAFDLFCQAAESGHPAAAYHLARMYLHGQGVEPDRKAAAVWIGRATAHGHPQAADLGIEVADVAASAEPSCRRLSAQAPRPPREILSLVETMAPEYGLDPQLVIAVMAAESGFRVSVRSPRNAIGLMQLIPDTAARFGVKNPLDPKDNIRGGMKYLRWLLSYFGGSVPLTLAAYNAGEGAVLRHEGIPPYKETQNYVRKILSVYPRERHPFEPGLAEPPSSVLKILAGAVASR